ncbi:FAD-binding protein [Candidatus Peribacteria bacterium]|jgi:UDP-N-acetylmuramate dehydrogenase|nr:FAD-binding protein [Candidatus Peribacteria bacterium]MBT4021423.1 FAD-binding protein [Candidatus Peribacteria bacterium]MBT4240439.1 FAD-binding protein [Candidatus Peribacteria bacterium]MBT4474521.1 FAD-binding protein [Candidatus Peribacteria bacterium]
MIIKENIPLAPKTTLKIGGDARFYAEITTKEALKEAYKFGDTNNIPVVILGSGSNTIFADGTINALVIKIVTSEVKINGNEIEVDAGKNLAQLVNELAELNLDLSPLTGIPGTAGGAVFGNAGQGCGKIWIDEYVDSICTFEKRLAISDQLATAKRSEDGRLAESNIAKNECGFGYRTSIFKNDKKNSIIWSIKLNVPSRSKEEVQTEIERLLKKRIESQPHKRTAGSCFLSLDKENPAWKLIDAANLRGKQIGGIKISEKHSNFLENTGGATFEDAKNLIAEIKSKIDQPLPVEMRLINNDGEIEN